MHKTAENSVTPEVTTNHHGIEKNKLMPPKKKAIISHFPAFILPNCIASAHNLQICLLE